VTQPQKIIPRGNYPLLPIWMGFLVFSTICCFTSRTPIAHIRQCQKKGDCLHNDFDLSCFVEASINELPREPSHLMLAKSQWFNWNKIFIKVKLYDNMVKWLNRADDSPDNVDVWKDELDDYTLENLKMMEESWSTGKG
jgi:hypothetical protein